MKFRLYDHIIEAVQLRWDTWSEICELIGKFPERMRGVYVNKEGAYSDVPSIRMGLIIPNPNGDTLAIENDWIIKNNGVIYSLKDNIFKSIYEKYE